jgi:NADH-quinone oxidoreductase subunit N
LKFEPKYFEYIILVLLAVFGFFIFLSGTNLIYVYIGLELQAICFYIIFGTFCKNNISYEAALKYFFLNVFASVIFVLGISFIYGYCGTINYEEIGVIAIVFSDVIVLNGLNLYNFGIFFILVGVFFKLALVPFHYWIGDAYEGLPFFIVLLYASIAKIPYVVFLINFLNILPVSFIALDLLFYLSILSIIFGSLIALYQKSLMRVLAFSSINHVGFIVLCISFGTIEGYLVSLNYLFIYIILTISVLSVLFLFRAFGINWEQWGFINVMDLSQMTNFHYIFGFFLACIFLSFAGIPPFAGFFAKLGVFMYLIKSGHVFSFLIVGFSSLISCVIYIRIVRFLFFSLNEKNKNLVLSFYTYIIGGIFVFFSFVNFFYLFIKPFLFTFILVLIII